MRFEQIKTFKVEELLLDEDNYRFKAAPDQRACIEKIYLSNPQYFRNLMISVAEDDLGEPLLVYQDKGKNIVLDGNRRLAVLKVLYSPEEYAPSAAVKEQANSLNLSNKLSFDVQAQVSSDKNLIFKTVYERHAAGHGKSRIGWSAYGAARFRYDQQIEEGNDWYALAILLETEKKYPTWTSFIDSNDYSHEVFRRVFKTALNKGMISRAIFSDRKQRIKTSIDKKLLDDAIQKVTQFLTSMQGKELSLSRSGKYADKESVDRYVDQFKLAPDNSRIKPPLSVKGKTSSGVRPSRDKQGYGIEESQAVLGQLKATKSLKLVGLYRSLCRVSLEQHPQLLYVGAWSFFETIATLIGKKEGTSFESFFGAKINDPHFGYNRTQKKDFKDTLEDIHKKGNLSKHSARWHPSDAHQLRVDFTTLEPFILKVLVLAMPEEKSVV